MNKISGYKEMWGLMDTYSFQLDSQTMSTWSCSICTKLAINACEEQCGCIYCRNCIEKCLNDGKKNCPNKTCESQSNEIDLKNIKTVHIVNKNISKLKVKCPSDSCEFVCDLLQMSEHIHECQFKKIECPFVKFGCSIRDLNENEISEHLLSELFKHMIMFIDWKTREKYENDWSVKRNGHESVNLRNLQIETEILKMKISELTTIINQSMDELTLYKNRMFKKHLQIKKLVEQLDESKNQKIEQVNTLVGGEIYKYKEPIKKITYYRWSILNTSDIKPVYSDHFFSKDGKYKLQLKFSSKGHLQNYTSLSNICIRILICDADDVKRFNQKLWPIKSSITITLLSSINESKISSEETFIFDGPNDKIIQTPHPHQFWFSKPDLIKQRILFDNGIIIHCRVDINQLF